MSLLTILAGLVTLGLVGYVFGKEGYETTYYTNSTPHLSVLDDEAASLRAFSHRTPKFFPFYSLGRFPNDVCLGANSLQGTCVVRGECFDNGGVAAGNCSTVTTQAVCCIYQMTCGGTTNLNNTYFYNTGYPGTYAGGGRCTIVVQPCDATICQLRIDFLSLTLASPDGVGVCQTDTLTITGGSSTVPTICGENSGQHVYVSFNGLFPITIAVATTGTFTFNRQWQLQIAQIACASATMAPTGCLQYYTGPTGVVSSFNYGSMPTSAINTIGLTGTRQLANTAYGICVRMEANMCSITWSQVGSDPFAFTVTGDVGVLDPTLLGSATLQSQTCASDYVIIPNPTQNGLTLGSDRFCGLGFAATTTNTKPFILYTVTDGIETTDVANRGFSLQYAQNACPIVNAQG